MSKALLFLVLLAACGPQATVPSRPMPSTCAQAGAPAVLYLTSSAAFRHSVLSRSVDLLAGTGAFNLAWRDDATVGLDAADLSACSAVLFYVSGEIPLSSAQKTALLDWVRGGGGFAALHSSTAALDTWPDYLDLVGARFNGHPSYGPAVVVPTSATHPAVAHLPGEWFINDEIYQFDSFRDGEVDVLLKLDASRADRQAIGFEELPWGFPLAWTGRYGQGRTFYSALGHGDIWDTEPFQTHVREGVRSVLRP